MLLDTGGAVSGSAIFGYAAIASQLSVHLDIGSETELQNAFGRS
jgi:hypothetical protein